MVLSSVDAFSDEDIAAPGPKPKASSSGRRSSLRMPARPRHLKLSVTRQYEASADPRHLANLIRSKCGCKCRCFSAFQTNQAHLDSWMKTRKLLTSMTKLEQDQHVRVLLCLSAFYCTVKDSYVSFMLACYQGLTWKKNILDHWMRSSTCWKLKTPYPAEAHGIFSFWGTHCATKASWNCLELANFDSRPWTGLLEEGKNIVPMTVVTWSKENGSRLRNGSKSMVFWWNSIWKLGRLFQMVWTATNDRDMETRDLMLLVLTEGRCGIYLTGRSMTIGASAKLPFPILWWVESYSVPNPCYEFIFYSLFCWC